MFDLDLERTGLGAREAYATGAVGLQDQRATEGNERSLERQAAIVMHFEGIDGPAGLGRPLGEHGHVQRVGFGPDAMTARQALELATLGGAKVLNRDDIGAIKPGMSADIVMFKLDQVGFAGALHDPVAALVFCNPANVSYSVINGRIVVKDGILQTIDLPLVIERHNRLAAGLALATGTRKIT